MITINDSDESKRLRDKFFAQHETEFTNGRLRLVRRRGAKQSRSGILIVAAWTTGIALIGLVLMFLWSNVRLIQTDEPACLIKGNINSKGDKIYHVPGSQAYDATKINVLVGERWFCTAFEAKESGWRAPRK